MPSADTPRPASKIAQVLALLQLDSGATLDELVAATGWLPHTTRAALTGLRKKGHKAKGMWMGGNVPLGYRRTASG